jgi:hypothetical protein
VATTEDKPVLFTWQQAAGGTFVFVVTTVVLQRALRFVCQNWISFDCAYYWPVSVFAPRMPSGRDLLVAAAVLAAFGVFVWLLERTRYDIRLVMLSGVLLILGLTFIHGIDVGFYAPVAGDAQGGVLVPYSLEGQEYYHDALKVGDAGEFFRNYNVIQPTLHRHAHTHPPGAVLTYYFLAAIFRDPAIIAVVIMLLAMLPSVWFAYRLFAEAFEEVTARYLSFLLVLLPAIQIYYLATIDALIAALLTAAVYLFCFGKGAKTIAAAAAAVTASFLLTFVSLFILPVLIGFELITKRSFKRSAIVIGSVVGFHALLYLLFGYNAWQSFRTASQFENANGFMLFAEPVNYFFTRLEDVAEIVFFLGPFLLVLFVSGFRSVKGRSLDLLTALACGTLLVMFLTSAFRTGETTRACLFLFPYLLFPVGYYLTERGTTAKERASLATLVFVQAVAMQLLGNYHW